MTDDNTRTRLLGARGQGLAAELVAAYAAGDIKTCEAIVKAEEQGGLVHQLISGLAHAAVSLARTAVEQTGCSEADLYLALHERAATAVAGTLEIDRITNPQKGTEA